MFIRVFLATSHRRIRGFFGKLCAIYSHFTYLLTKTLSRKRTHLLGILLGAYSLQFMFLAIMLQFVYLQVDLSQMLFSLIFDGFALNHVDLCTQQNHFAIIAYI